MEESMEREGEGERRWKRLTTAGGGERGGKEGEVLEVRAGLHYLAALEQDEGICLLAIAGVTFHHPLSTLSSFSPSSYSPPSLPLPSSLPSFHLCSWKQTNLALGTTSW